MISERTDQPFFILGSPRSGTTLLRDVLRSHERLAAPEETFYFRWHFPFGTHEFRNTYLNNPTIRKHRAMDGLSEEEFQEALERCRSRKEIMDFHGRFVAGRSGKPRWFDKTPQNVYGALMIASAYPESRLVCIWRNPLNVVSSLLEGRQMKVATIEGAINYWNEAAQIVTQLGRAQPDRVVTLRYEDLTERFEPTIVGLLEALGEDPALLAYRGRAIHEEQNRYRRTLTDAQVEQVLQETGPFRRLIGY